MKPGSNARIFVSILLGGPIIGSLIVLSPMALSIPFAILGAISSDASQSPFVALIVFCTGMAYGLLIGLLPALVAAAVAISLPSARPWQEFLTAAGLGGGVCALYGGVGAAMTWSGGVASLGIVVLFAALGAITGVLVRARLRETFRIRRERAMS